ncbi:MAG: type II toxin-antitoxin system VapC family toxin [Thermoanaerobaculales bacterium]
MVDALILETSFLVDLERELIVGDVGPAHLFLESHQAQKLHITFTIAGELAAGPRMNDRAKWDRSVSPFEVLECTSEVSWRYGRLYRYLRENGLLIDANDLWIAATALAFGMPIVTRNERHFGRVPALNVIGYASIP